MSLLQRFAPRKSQSFDACFLKPCFLLFFIFYSSILFKHLKYYANLVRVRKKNRSFQIFNFFLKKIEKCRTEIKDARLFSCFSRRRQTWTRLTFIVSPSYWYKRVHTKMEYNISVDKEYTSSGWLSKLLDCNLLIAGYDFRFRFENWLGVSLVKYAKVWTTKLQIEDFEVWKLLLLRPL